MQGNEVLHGKECDYKDEKSESLIQPITLT